MDKDRKPISLLMVDDGEDNRLMIQAPFEEAGLTPVSFKGQVEAMKTFRNIGLRSSDCRFAKALHANKG